jgi:phage shock protein PspC (stress-responsive transcriptional regulator)
MRKRYYHDDDYEYRYRDKPLRLDTRHKKIGGVCGGIANYFDWSRSTVRVLSVIALLFAPQLMLPAYGVAYLIMERDAYDEEVY